MMAGNEESRIACALQSIVEWVAEIVVVLDARSTDQTEKIALSFGARVFREPWKGMIGQANSALEKCTHAWVFGLDADEVVSNALRESIVRLFAPDNQERDSFSGFKFSRRTWFMGQWILHGDWYPDTQLRLFLKERGAWGGKEPHHKAVVRGKTTTIKGDLLHYSHSSLSDYLLKMDSFSRRAVEARDIATSPSTGFTIAVRAVWRFFRAFVIRRGFLDGPIGFYLALSQSFFTGHRHWSLREAALRSSTPRLFGFSTANK
jgi:glycosyltransferase involved in cell wall biosynthesis